MTFYLLSHRDIDAFCHLYNKAFMYVCIYVFKKIYLVIFCT